MVEGPFKDYPFLAGVGSYMPPDDTRFAQTLAERQGQMVINVKDWGARGDGLTDDTDAILAAQAAQGATGFSIYNKGSTIFFPPGIYIIGKGGTQFLTMGAIWKGSGRDATILRGNYNPGGQQEQVNNGFLVQAWGPAGMCDLTVHNMSTGDTSGAMLVNASGASLFIEGCHFIGRSGFASGDTTFGGRISDCLFTCTRAPGPASDADRTPWYKPSKFLQPLGGVSRMNGGIGGILGGFEAANCRAVGFDIGFSVLGGEVGFRGLTASRCGIGYVAAIKNGAHFDTGLDFGTFPAAWYQLYAGHVSSCVADRCTIGVYLYNSKGFWSANYITGVTGPTDPAPVQGMNWTPGSNLVTVTTAVPHNIVGNPTLQILDASTLAPLSGWTIDTDAGFVVANPTGANTFTYSGPASAPPTYASGGAWNYPIDFGFTTELEGSGDASYIANVVDAKCAVASATWSGAGSNMQSNVWCTRGDYGWILPDNNGPSFSAGAWEFHNCGGDPTKARPGTTPFPGIPNVRYFPGQQSNVGGYSNGGAERSIINGQAGVNFGEPVYSFFILSAPAAAGAFTLNFPAPLPAGAITVGMTVDENQHLGVNGNQSVAAVNTATGVVTLDSPTVAALPVAGYKINFLRLGGSSRYKVRFNGDAWVREA